MAHFVKLENNIVTNGIVINNDMCGEPTLTFPDTESAGRAYIANGLKFAGTWAQTSYNGSFRNCYAGLGFHFLPDAGEYGEFVPPPSPPEPPPPIYPPVN